MFLNFPLFSKSIKFDKFIEIPHHGASQLYLASLIFLTKVGKIFKKGLMMMIDE
jgi:hypothetical protein